MEEKNVIQLQEEMRIKVAFDDLKDDDEADQRNACALFEKRFGVGAAKKLRARLGLVEVKVEEPKVKIARWRQLANGGWEYLLGGEIVWRRGFGPRPKQLDATDEPEEPKAAIGETGGETGWIEDDTNAANNIRRKLWRLEAALKWINRDDWWIEEVGAALWWMSEGNRSMGCQVFVAWAGEEFRDRWQKGFDSRGNVERIYEEAQRKGWRYPIAHNLNKLHEMTMRAETALVRAGSEIYHFGGRLVRSVSVEVDAAKGRKTRIARLVP